MSDKSLAETVICSNDDLGNMVYPFLTGCPDWAIHNRALGAGPGAAPTLRWVKDNKVIDLVIPGTDTDTFLERSGLRLSMHKGAFVLSKRLSRIMRPFRYWRFLRPEAITIEFAPDLDGKLWDGCALISRRLVEMMGLNLSHIPDLERAVYERELASCRRFEITVLHSGGQEKGHAYVVEDLAVDLVLPAGATKTEVCLDGRTFVGLQPVHSEDQMKLDIQSLVNLHPFFRPEHLLAWASLEADLFLSRIKNGELEAIIGRLYNLHSAADLLKLRRWLIGDYLLSGGSLMWFPGAVRAMTRQFLHRLEHNEERFRCPMPGGRYYIFPAAVGGRQVPNGHICLDPDSATAWVADQDWLDFIVPVLGGCDGDDALWIFPFTDQADGEQKILAWRSPNQLGEYVLLRPTEDSHTIRWATTLGPMTWPQMHSRQLPDRIDTRRHTYGQLIPMPQETHHTYTINCMEQAQVQALANKSVLGTYCNTLMAVKAIYGRLSDHLPARLEDVIDGTVKQPLDMAPVRDWCQMVSQRIRRQGKAVPTAMQPRLNDAFVATEDHWLDVLHAGIQQMIATYKANADVLEGEAQIPMTVFTQGLHWQGHGRQVTATFQKLLKQFPDDFDQVQLKLKALCALNNGALLGAAAHIYTNNLRDSLLWLLDLADGRPGAGRAWLEALRAIGLIGEPVWTREDAIRFYAEPVDVGVPVRLNGVWFNLSAAETVTCMSQLQPEQAQSMKQALAQMSLVNKVLYTEVLANERLITRTHDGRLFGYVQAGQELRLLKKNKWVIRHTAVRDGNVYAVMS